MINENVTGHRPWLPWLLWLVILKLVNLRQSVMYPIIKIGQQCSPTLACFLGNVMNVTTTTSSTQHIPSFRAERAEVCLYHSIVGQNFDLRPSGPPAKFWTSGPPPSGGPSAQLWFVYRYFKIIYQIPSWRY